MKGLKNSTTTIKTSESNPLYQRIKRKLQLFFFLYNRETLLFGVWPLVEHSTEDFKNCVRQRFSRQGKWWKWRNV